MNLAVILAPRSLLQRPSSIVLYDSLGLEPWFRAYNILIPVPPVYGSHGCRLQIYCPKLGRPVPLPASPLQELDYGWLPSSSFGGPNLRPAATRYWITQIHLWHFETWYAGGNIVQHHGTLSPRDNFYSINCSWKPAPMASFVLKGFGNIIGCNCSKVPWTKRVGGTDGCGDARGSNLIPDRQGTHFTAFFHRRLS